MSFSQPRFPGTAQFATLAAEGPSASFDPGHSSGGMLRSLARVHKHPVFSRSHTPGKLRLSAPVPSIAPTLQSRNSWTTSHGYLQSHIAKESPAHSLNPSWTISPRYPRPPITSRGRCGCRELPAWKP